MAVVEELLEWWGTENCGQISGMLCDGVKGLILCHIVVV